MQIYGPSHIHGAQGVSAPHGARPAQGPSSVTSAPLGDQLDISDAARIAERVAELPDIRADRVAELRAAILDGSYETHDKLSTAVDRLLDEIAQLGARSLAMPRAPHDRAAARRLPCPALATRR